MTQAEFAGRVVAMQDTLYRVSCTILPLLCDREDAIQSAIEKARENGCCCAMTARWRNG